jgi:CDP-glucose 4,6-dehydratase
MDTTTLSPDFWRGKRVVITGHTGFKGSWLALWLNRLGANVKGISLKPQTKPNLYGLAQLDSFIDSEFADIRDYMHLNRLIAGADPEIVFHLAAQALVRPGYNDPLTTFSTNVQGTANLLESLRSARNLRVIVAVTTDKVYAERPDLYPHRETDPLGGYDPYSASKAAAELIISSYRDSFFRNGSVAIASARAGNVIGGGDWSQDRLIPDAIRAWSQDIPLRIRRPAAIRPWQHVLEPLYGYLILGQRLWHDSTLADAYNFGPDYHGSSSVGAVTELACKLYGKGQILLDQNSDELHETDRLTLETAKARQILNIVPRWPLAIAIEKTIRWYKDYETGISPYTLCVNDIKQFEQYQHEIL